MRFAHFTHSFAPFIFITAQLARASEFSGCFYPVYGCSSRHVAASYFAAWHADDSTVNQSISWHKYNTIIFAFVPTTSDPRKIELDDPSQKILSKLVDDGHKNNVSVLAGFGGWSGSRFFSSLVSPHFRGTYARTVLKFIKDNKLDGADFDWEYPTTTGIGCNNHSKHDSNHFLWFLEEFRSLDGAQDLIVSAAVSPTPFIGADGNPMSDVSAFALVFDYINLMVYDIWGGWSPTTGPNAPLNDSCAASQNQQGSAVSAVRNWATSGFPLCKMVLGVPAYGRLFSVAPKNASDASGKLQPYALFDKAHPPAGDKWDSTASGVDECGNNNTVGSIIHPWSMIEDGWLTQSGTPAAGIEHTYDDCSQTPSAYNSKTQQMLSYDDPTSFEAKGKFIANAGLAGFAMWETLGDHNDLLLDAIREGTGADFYK